MQPYQNSSFCPQKIDRLLLKLIQKNKGLWIATYFEKEEQSWKTSQFQNWLQKYRNNYSVELA